MYCSWSSTHDFSLSYREECRNWRMEIFETVDRYIIHRREYNESLWCNKIDGGICMRSGQDLKEAWNPVCQGIIFTLIGKLKLYPGSDWRLLLVTEQTLVGHLPGGHEVYRIDKVGILPLTPESRPIEVELQPCPLHTGTNPRNGRQEATVQQRAIQQSWREFKSSATNQIRGMKGVALVKDIRERERQEKRLLEELERMFTDSESFYYSPTGDLSNSIQQQSSGAVDKTFPLWKQTNDRFFWNKFMLHDIISSEDPRKDLWIQPVIQGYFQVHRCQVNLLEKISHFRKNDEVDMAEDEEDGFILYEHFKTGENLKQEEFDLLVISRRSRHRAGTRYKRRGVNSEGHVANYVETEQIVCVKDHTVSFVQVRGSVPVYWSQPGYKYRPPPQVKDDDEETAKAFKAHFNEELKFYHKQVIVSLIENGPREKIIGDTFLKHIFLLDSPDLVYVTFDFHEHCRGMKFENIGILIDAIEDLIDEMKYCWVDAKGIIEVQNSVFRINCMDCLDRTNVIEATIARTVLVKLLLKLGRLLPDQNLPSSCKRVHNVIWANNGDAISRQYAGTAAMKGDFTRTGERKITGVMKDGYNSANRYYLNRFRDSYRQLLIDMMLGNPVTEDFAIFDDESVNKVSREEDSWTSEKEEAIAQMVLQSQLALLPPEEECLGGWALVEPFIFSESDTPEDEDVILLLTHEAYYIARYDNDLEQVMSYERIPLSDLDKIEIGPEFHYFQGRYIFMRIYRKCGRNVGYFYTLRAIQNRSVNEAKAILMSISELFVAVAKLFDVQLRLLENKIEKKRSKTPPLVIPLTSKRRLNSTGDLKLEKQETEKKSPKDRPLSMEIPAVIVCEQPVEGATNDSNDALSNKTSSPGGSPIHKSSSDSAIARSRKGCELQRASNDIANEHERQSRMDAIFKKTRTVLSAGGTKARSGLQSFARYAKSSDSGKTMGDGQVSIACESPSSSQEMVQKRAGFGGSALRDPLAKIKGKINVRLGNQSPEEDRNSRSLFPDLKNKISTVLLSPKVKRKTESIVLSEEEQEKRRNCRTLIMEL